MASSISSFSFLWLGFPAQTFIGDLTIVPKSMREKSEVEPRYIKDSILWRTGARSPRMRWHVEVIEEERFRGINARLAGGRAGFDEVGWLAKRGEFSSHQRTLIQSAEHNISQNGPCNSAH